MSFSSPLWLLLLALVPLVVILHSIAIRWRDARVSSLAFWSEALRERRTSVRFNRVLRNLALLLEILAIAALSVSLAGPRAPGLFFASAGDTILVLDVTASMKTREGGRTRFDLARSRALGVLDGMGRGARMSLIAAGGSPRLLVPFTDDRALLRRAIRSASPTDEPGSPRESMLLALSLRDPRRGGQVVLVTDGAWDPAVAADFMVPGVRVLAVGSARPNVGITSLQFRRTLGGEEAYEMFLSVRSWSPRPVSVPLAITADRAPGRLPVVSETVSLAPGEERSLSVPWQGPTEGRVTAEIATGDDFAVDDRAFAVFAPAREARVLIAGPGDWFLERAFAALPGVTVQRTDQYDPSGGLSAPEIGETRAKDSAGAADVVVYDGAEVPPLGKGNYILFASVPPNLPLRVVGTLPRPQVTSWDRSSPLLESVPFEGLSITQALQIVPGTGFTPLVMSQDRPLVLAWDHAGLKVLVVAFDASRSDFPLRPGFPIFLANALSWFFPSWLAVQADQVQAGEAKVLPFSGEALTVVLPDGSRETLGGVAPSVEFGGTSEVGFYRVESAMDADRRSAAPREFAVSLLSADESDIEPRFSAGEGTGQADERAFGSEPGAEAWVPLALAAVLLILAEWLAWLRAPEVRGRPR